MASYCAASQLAARLRGAGKALGLAGIAAAGWAAYPVSISSAEQAAASALDPKEWKSLKLVGKEDISHNTRIFRFALEDPSQVVGLPVASCLLTRAPVGTKEDGSPSFAIRPYTPTSAPDQRGGFDLIVKVYPDGKMSTHMDKMKVGERLDFKGPIVKFAYKPNMHKHIGMIAGGTGITPMLQVAEEILRNPADKTHVTLVFANQTPGDVLCREKIDELARKHPNFEVHYTVDRVQQGLKAITWRGGVGYVTRDVLAQHMPPPGKPGAAVFVCGPPPMMKAISGDKAPDKSQGELSGLLQGMGFSAEQVFKF